MPPAFVNLDKWNSLPKAYFRPCLSRLGHYANNWMMAKYDQQNPQALRRLIAGTKLHVFSQPIMEASYKAGWSCTARSRKRKRQLQEGE
jgi:TRAP-type mannitol/chloroaromatic compound transport system substrate-binding protein